jgi:hypothetical protein
MHRQSADGHTRRCAAAAGIGSMRVSNNTAVLLQHGRRHEPRGQMGCNENPLKSGQPDVKRSYTRTVQPRPHTKRSHSAAHGQNSGGETHVQCRP